MADKKTTPQFRSDAERKKWASLEHKAGTSLHKIAQGKGTTEDFKNVDKTLAGLSKLAKSVFSDAVKAAEAQVATVQKANLEKSKEDQETFAKSVGEVLKAQMPEILAKIKDIIELESLEQDGRFEKTLSDQLQSFSSFLPPKDLPTTDDMVAMHEATIEQQSSVDDTKWESRQKKLIDTFSDRVADVVKATILSMSMSTVSSTAAQSARPSNVPRLTGSNANQGVVPSSVARLGMSMVQGARTRDNSDAIDVESKVVPTTGFNPTNKDSTVPRLSGPSSSTSGPSLSLSKAAETAITNAATAQTKLHEQIRDFLQNGGTGTATPGGKESTEDDADEDKKADVWWRSFGKWIGDKYDSAKDKVSTGMSWLTTLGTGLMSMLLAPQLYETIASKAKELLTWDNIKTAAEAAWNFMYDKAKSVVEWISDKLGLGPYIDKAKAVFDKLASGVEWLAKKLGLTDKVGKAATAVKGAVSSAASWVGKKLGIGGKDSATAGGTVPDAGTAGSTGVASAQNLVSPSPTPAQQAAAGTEAANTTMSAPGSITSNVANAGRSFTGSVGGNSYNFSTTTSAGGVGAGNNRSSMNFSAPSTSSTTSAPGSSVRTTPAVTTPVAGSPSATTTNARTAAPSQSTSTIGINSFGINSGTDDSLALMNLGVISG